MHPALLIPALATILASHALRHESAAMLGFRAEGFGACARKFGPAVIGSVALLFGVGRLLGTIRSLSFPQATQSLAVYLPWGLFQQYLLNGYFLRRFEAAIRPSRAALLTAALFCAAHAPNWFLMLVTPVGALLAIWVFRRYRNLYVPGIAHAVLGFTLYLVVPDSITHHLRVGPGWFGYR